MRETDLGPFWRSSIGFDRLFDLIDETLHKAGEDNHPPYDIAREGKDKYRLSLALAGFTSEEVSVTAERNLLTVEGGKAETDDREYLHRGIPRRAFRHQFSLADYVEVTGAYFENGLLQIDLVREAPEAIKPRRIEIKSGFDHNQPQIEHKQAA
jgi:molecular chaperone IbpA